MRRAVLALIIALLTFGCFLGGITYVRRMRTRQTSGDETFTIRWNGLNRRYIVHAPRSYDGRTRLPVVVMLHGAGGTGAGAMEETGWAQKADEANFLAVFPDATPPDPSTSAQFLTNPQIWNDGSGRGHAGRRDIDDVGFVNFMLDDLSNRFRVDENRIFVTGFSNGASMTFRVGAELSSRVAAIAPVSGHFWLNISKLDHPVSMIFLTGTEDPLNPINGGEVRLPWGTTENKPPIKESIVKWVKLLECPSEPKIIQDKDGVKAFAYGPGREGSEVLFHTIEGLGHTWPGGKSLLPERLVGKTTDKIKATDAIWNFFQNHPKK